MDSLKTCSLYQLPLMCKTETNDSQYECLWRLGQWDEKLPNVDFENMHNAYEKLRYFSLKSLHDKDDVMYTRALQNARRCIIEDLQCSSLESCKTLYGSLSKLQSLQELEDFGNGDVLDVINKWKLQDTTSINEFDYLEPIKAQRIAVLNIFLNETNKKEDVKQCLIDSHLQLAMMARKCGGFNVARSSLGNLYYIADTSQENQLKVVFEDAQLNWESGNKDIAQQMLRQLLIRNIEDHQLKASVLKLYGTWIAETSSQSSQVIIKDYLLKSITVSTEGGASGGDMFDAYLKLAKFADNEYLEVRLLF